MELLECGKIVSTHGVRGEIKINPWCDGPDFLCEFEELYLKDGRVLELERARVHKNCVIAKVAGIDSIESAMPYINAVVYLNKEDVELPDGTYFIADLIGLSVVDYDTGRIYGKITDVMQTGANDVYTVTAEEGDTLIPAISDVVMETDLEAGEIRIRPLEGLFSDEI